ncbi:MAG: S41 family peptidase [Chitinispirillia bacterium]|jgi:hypothetical protein
MVTLPRNNILSVFFIPLFFLFCRYPEGPDNIDIVELEHVWQYCRAFSLYSERVPVHSDLLNYSTNYEHPKFLLNALNDSLFIYWKNEKMKIADYDRSYTALAARLRITGKYNFTEPKDCTTVFFRKLTKKTAYFKIKEFAYSTDKEVSKFDSYSDSTQNIIIDLKGNGGGYITPCKNIIELFLPSNTAYLKLDSMKTYGNVFGKDSATWVSQNTGDAWEGKNITILIDSLTASASELLTVSLKDGLKGRTFVIGTRSLGKAIGQLLFPLSNGAGIFLTVMRFKPLSGIEYHEKGIIPDSLFTGSFEDELKTAGKMYESNFEEILDTFAFKEILDFNSYVLRSGKRIFGCFSILDSIILKEF